MDFLWLIFGWIVKGIVILMMVWLVGAFIYFIWIMATNGGRKWYYYDASKPWKGGYWAPLLPLTPPYNDYKWNPDNCRFEHKVSCQPLCPCQQPVKRCGDDTKKINRSKTEKRRPEWLRFLFEEAPATLLEKRRRKKRARERDNAISYRE